MSDGGLATSMGHEINIDSIQALDKRIEEVAAELVRLKRSRNSLLTVARVPPEILGHIFGFNITTEVGDPKFAGIQKDSYNFLLVCHHWFEVARRLPELWSFWGNSFEDWKRQLPRSDGTAPLDLVLDGAECQVGPADEALLDTLKDYTARNAIRKVHLRSDDIRLLTTIVSSLTPEWCIRDSNIESIALNGVDVTALLAHQRYPKLRDLSLSGRFWIWELDWHSVDQNITGLVNLSLSSNALNSIPSVSQILSLLTSNPNIRTLALESLKVRDDIGLDSNEPRVQLCHLEKFSLTGDFYRVFPILRQLELPERVDHARLEFSNCMSREVHETVMPYIRDYFQRDSRFKDRLGIVVSRTNDSITLRASVIGAGYHGPDGLPQHGPPYLSVSAIQQNYTLGGFSEREELCVNILALLPRENIVYFETNLSLRPTMEAIVVMPNLEALYLIGMLVEDGFLLPDPNGPDMHTKLFPHLQRLYLQDATAQYFDWNPLFRYATNQTSGNHPFSLFLFGEYMHICFEVAQRIEGLVEEFVYDRDAGCPFHECDSYQM